MAPTSPISPAAPPAMGTSSDPETQALYNTLSARGVFRTDPEAQLLGHVLRARGVVQDSTQGGLMAPPQPLSAMDAPPLLPDHSDAPEAQLLSPSVPAGPSAQRGPSPNDGGLINGIKNFFGAGDQEGTFHKSLSNVIAGTENTARDFAKVAAEDPAGIPLPSQHYDQKTGKVVVGSWPPPNLLSHLGTVVHDVNPVPPILGPNSMIGHGAEAAAGGHFEQFAKGVLPGIGKEFYNDPVGDSLNILALVGMGHLTLSAGADTLLSRASSLDEAAGKTSDPAEAAKLRAGAEKMQRAGQALHKAAYDYHRNATGRSVGDFARNTAANAIDRFYGAKNRFDALELEGKPSVRQRASGVSKWLRAHSDPYQKPPALAQLPPLSSDADGLPAAAEDGGRFGHLEIGPADEPQNVAAQQSSAPVAAPQAASPLPPELLPLSADDPAPAAPGLQLQQQDIQEEYQPPKNIAPLPVPKNFTTDFDAKLAATAAAAAQQGQPLPAPLAHQSAVLSLAHEFDPSTGLLRHESLQATFPHAIESVKSGTPVTYGLVRITPGQSQQSGASTRAAADTYASVIDPLGGNTSFYATGKPNEFSFITAGVPPTLLQSAITAHQAAHPALSAPTLTPISATDTPSDIMARVQTLAALGIHTLPSEVNHGGTLSGGGGAVPILSGTGVSGQQASSAHVGGSRGSGALETGAVEAASQEHTAGGGNSSLSEQLLEENQNPVYAGGGRQQQSQANAEERHAKEPRTGERSALEGGERAAASEASDSGRAAASVGLAPGDYFSFQGRNYHLGRVDQDGVEATDITGFPIIRQWSSREAFERTTGQKLAPSTIAQMDAKERETALKHLEEVKDDPEVKHLVTMVVAAIEAHMDELGTIEQLTPTEIERVIENCESVINDPEVGHIAKMVESEVMAAQEAHFELTHAVRDDRGRSLEGRASEDVRSAEEKGTAHAGTAESARHVREGSQRSGGTGIGHSSSGGDGVSTVSVSSERDGDAKAGRRPAGKTDADRSAQYTGTKPNGDPVSVSAIADDDPTLHAPGHINTNYRITEKDAIGVGSESQKLHALLQAIQTLKAIEARQGLATPEEQAILVKFPGWGWTGNLLHSKNADPRSFDNASYRYIRNQLTPDEFAAARRATLNSHYTSPEIIKGMWQYLLDAGFTGGRVLEPAAGNGLFVGLAPDLVASSTFRLGEKDSLTGRIATQLYQNSRVDVAPFETLHYANESQDLVISNFPFGSIRIVDRAFVASHEDSSLLLSRIHNYFFAKSLDLLRPGGIMAAITSAGTLNARDATGYAVRKYLDEHAVLLGAVRLPNTAFKENAGTEVTTDIIFLQKKGEGVPATGHLFQDVGEVPAIARDGETSSALVNEYFMRNPEMVLGDHATTGSMYGGKQEYTVLPHAGQNLTEELTDALRTLPIGRYSPFQHTGFVKAVSTEAQVQRSAKRSLPKGAFAKDSNGHLTIMQTSGLSAVDFTPAETATVSAYVDLRDAALELINAQRVEENAENLLPLQAKVKTLYAAYTKKYGPLHAAKNSVWINDPEAMTVLALENYDKKTKTATTAAIMDRQVVSPVKPVEHVDTPQDALIVSLRETGSVSLKRMEQLSGLSEATLQDALQGLIFMTPEGKLVTRDEYGSGNVRAKLAAAKKLEEEDAKTWSAAVSFLQTVQPKDLTAGQISAKIGAQWIPKQIFELFLQHLYGGWRASHFNVSYSPYSGNWKVDMPTYKPNGVEATQKWGTDAAPAHKLVEKLMNSTSVIVNKKDDKGNTSVDEEATIAARLKMAAIKKEFSRWIMRDPEQATYLTDIYNNVVNVYRERFYNGSHLEFPGKVSDEIFKLRKHQVDAVWRIIQSTSTLLAHEVGTGKTATMIAAGMEMRRMGLRNKIVYVVKKPTLPQFAAEFSRLYPGSRILIAGKENFSAASRQEFMGRIATGDWDAVVMSHENLKALPVHPDTVRAFYNEQIAEMQKFLETLAGATRANGKDFTVKETEKKIAGLEKKRDDLAQRLAAVQDENIYWDDLGFDHIFVDEAQKYKNVFTVSSRKGFGQDGSDIANDALMKVQDLLKNKGGVTFATGTPLTNSIAEMHNLLRFLAPNLLKEQNIEHFDAWAQQYGDMKNDLEQNLAGEYNDKERFASFSNLPELMQLYLSVTDQILAEDVPELVRPSLVDEAGHVTNKPIIIESRPNADQRKFYDGLEDRIKKFPSMQQAKEIKDAGGVPDGWLKLSSDCQMVTLDARTRIPGAYDDPNSKINQMIDKTFLNWEKTQADKRTQLLFLDRGVPGGQGFNLYHDIRSKLIKRGIPKDEIAFIHDYETDDKKEELFDAVNNGSIRIVIGSRDKLGVGVNVQKRLIAIHQIDPTWRPDQIEQADGRILRHGNLFADQGVKIYQYVNVDTFDAFMWTRIAQKAGFIKQVTSGRSDMREAEDITSDEKFSPNEMKAVSSGNPYLIEYLNVQAQLESLADERKAYENNKVDAFQTQQNLLKQGIPNTEKQIAFYSELSAHLKEKPDPFTIKIGNVVFDDKEARTSAAAALWDKAQHLETRTNAPLNIGSFRGLEITLQYQPVNSYDKNLMRQFLVPGVRFGLRTVETDPVTFDLKLDEYPEGTKPTGLLTRLENLAARIPTEAARVEKQLAQMHQDMETVNGILSEPFAAEAKFEALEEKQAALKLKVGADLKGKGGWGRNSPNSEKARGVGTSIAPAVKKGDRDAILAKYLDDEPEKINAPQEATPKTKKALPDVAVKVRSMLARYLRVMEDDLIRACHANTPARLKILKSEIKKLLDSGFIEYDDGNENSIYKQYRKTSLFKLDSRTTEESVEETAPETNFSRALPANTGQYQPGTTLNSGLDPGLMQLYTEDIVPGAEAAKSYIERYDQWIKALLSPASSSPGAAMTARMYRENNARFYQNLEQAEAALHAGRGLITKMTQPARWDFFDQVETGTPIPVPDLQTLGTTLTQMFENDWTELADVTKVDRGPGIDNYLAHLYKNPNNAAKTLAALHSRRPMEGQKGFLKQRKYATLKEGMAQGLEPVTDDPVEMALLAHRQIQQYIMAHRVLNEMKATKLAIYVPATQRRPPGLVPLNDRIAEVWGGPTVSVQEAFDAEVMSALNDIMKNLGIEHERSAGSGQSKWGSYDGKKTIKTRFAGPESSVIHELAHALDTRYHIWKYLSRPGLRVPGVSHARKTIQQELTALADLRYRGRSVPPSYRAYVHQRSEKVANAFTAMLYAPEEFEKVAPTVKARLRRFIREHKELTPLLAIKPGLMLGTRTQDIPVGGMIKRGAYYAAPEVARVFNNYLSPGLWGNPLYDGMRYIGNFLNQAQLGFSGFHFLFTVGDAITSQAAEGIYRTSLGAENIIRGGVTGSKPRSQLGIGQIGSGIKDINSAVLSPFTNALRGSRLMREYRSPGAATDMAQIVDAYISGGGRPRMDPHEMNNAVSRFRTQLRRAGDRTRTGNLIGATAHLGGAALLGIPAAMEWMMRPLMNQWVPLMKAGAAAKMIENLIDRQGNQTLTRDELRKEVAKIIDSVDNRMGQLNYDNLFWQKTWKEAMMVGVRSVGWTVGTIRELGGAGGDALPPNIYRRIKNDEPLVTRRMAYVFALAVTVALTNAIYQWLHGQGAPKDWRDLLFARSGGVDAEGKPNRVVMPNYLSRDVYSYATEPVKAIENKTNPLIASVIDLWQNEDFYGDEIHNPNDPLTLQAQQVAGYLVSQSEPFSLMNYQAAAKKGWEPLAESIAGLMPAPKSVNDTPAETLMYQFARQDGKRGPDTPEQAEKKQILAQIRNTAAGSAKRKALFAALRAGEITKGQTKSILRGDPLGEDVSLFQHLTASQAIKVFKLGNEKEMHEFAPFLPKKLKGQPTPIIKSGLAALREFYRK